MQGPRIVVVSDSRPIRETLDLLLSDKYETTVVSSTEADRSSPGLCQLLICDDAAARTSAWVRRCQSEPGFPLLTVGEYAPGSSALPFEAGELLAQIDGLLKGYSAAKADAQEAMRFPLVPLVIEQLARRARRTSLPVLILGEPGVGKSRLARGLHPTDAGRFLMVPAEAFEETGLQRSLAVAPAGTTTLYLPELSGLTTHGRQLLREIVDTNGLSTANGWMRVRLVTASVEPIDRLRAIFRHEPDLFHHLSVLTLQLPPLRERVTDLPAIVQQLSARLGDRRNPVRFTPAAIDRLQNYLWFGNLAELEAVIGRTLMLTDQSWIDRDDLLFRIETAARPAVPARVPEAAAAAGADDRIELDMVLTELAHELKNPMVVIKTAAQHLERLLSDETDRNEMARLTGQAVDRMDRTLENLIQFTRFREPIPQDVALNDLLTRCLSAINADFAERQVMLDYRAPARQTVHVDVLQLAYALENLLRVIVRDLSAGATLAIRPMLAHHGFSIEFRAAAHPISKQLALAASDDPAAAAAQPIGFVFATTLVERNGGSIRSSIEGDRMMVAIELPPGVDGVEGHEEATRLDS